MIFDRLTLTLWYLKRPRLYPRLARKIAAKLAPVRSVMPDSQAEALAWCDARAISSSAAVHQVVGQCQQELFTTRYAAQLARSQAIAEQCPVLMGGPGDLDLLYALAEHVQAVKVVETGVAYGWSSLSLLLSLVSRAGSQLISTDMPYPGRNNDRYVGCIVPPELTSDWLILRSADRQALPKALHRLGVIDLCHYDSDKSQAGRSWAYPLLWRALKPGGVFVSDDISDNVAFRDFTNSLDVDPVVVRHQEKFIGILVKP